MAAPVKKYPHLVEVAITEEQNAHLEHFVELTRMPKSAFMRHLLQNSVDKKNGTYDPLPSPEVMAHAFAQVMKEMQRNG